MPNKPKTSLTIVFEKLSEFKDSDEVKEAAAVADEAEEIQELRRIIEETNTPVCVEFATT